MDTPTLQPTFIRVIDMHSKKPCFWIFSIVPYSQEVGDVREIGSAVGLTVQITTAKLFFLLFFFAKFARTPTTKMARAHLRRS